MAECGSTSVIANGPTYVCCTFDGDLPYGAGVSKLSQIFHFQFGAGSRTCIGKHISLLEMRMLVPALYRNFDLQLVDKAASLSYQCHWVRNFRIG